ncbi:Cas10/Cmr2 second palm domain-containing protein [Vibrio sp. WXL210]|uniref:Cas10/Cmr2 second palm domain-containing protein n=1 Tax=Vibrio sp. WXL210 TaxID=3450709 RepID=UPI003EC67CF3
MIYAYLFEAKSIQQYLFSSGKLKDVISASERLDKLIDNDKNSVLSRVLERAQLVSDLNKETNEIGAIHFLRCKGGAFYSVCTDREPLSQLRSIWTLTIAQLFPSLEFTDALVSEETLHSALELGHKTLAQDRNAPKLKLPYAPGHSERYSRTGAAAVVLSALASRAVHPDEATDGTPPSLDIDTEKHRQAYQALNLRHDAALQHRFTPNGLKEKISYPIDFENQFEFSSKGALEQLSKSQRESVKDMALIHIDGNGLGILLMKLKQSLNGCDDSRYRRVFRAFSDALNASTMEAAKEATFWLYEQVVKEGSEIDADGRCCLPMRPIVLGGDDITLFCRADLALTYARKFCQAFKRASGEQLKKLDLRLKGVKYLTASGGILYNKAAHPFMHSHHLVEALCDKAKVLTKSVYGIENNDKVGPSALAFYRLSNTTTLSLSQVEALTNDVRQGDEHLHLAQTAYFVEHDDNIQIAGLSHRALSHLDKLVSLVTSKSDSQTNSLSLAKFRQMAGEIAQGDLSEAQRIYYRALSLAPKKHQQALQTALANLNPHCEAAWYWRGSKPKELQSFLSDLLVVGHYQLVDPPQANKDKSKTVVAKEAEVQNG